MMPGSAASSAVVAAAVRSLPIVALRLSLALRSDLVELCHCPLELVVEQPHRIENLAEGRRTSRAIGLPESEDAVVAQIAHDPRLGDAVASEVARVEGRPGRSGDDLDELEYFHL